MNREDIIRMAREAGFDLEARQLSLGSNVCGTHEELERFAALVAAAERAEVERLKLLCEEMLRELYVYRASEYLRDVTAAIRARGNK
jgi:hypothetical protein